MRASVADNDDIATIFVSPLGGSMSLLDITQKVVWQTVLSVHELPTGVTETVWGLADTWDVMLLGGATRLAVFALTAGENLMVRTDDDTTDSGLVDTGIALVADAKHVFKIDFTDMANVRFYVDGVQVCAATTFDMSAASSLAFAYSVGSATGVGHGSVDVDRVCWWHD
jgi:hypothetical protein